MLPNFFLAGTPKSGTTTLFELLRQHPECFIPKIKTPEYFNKAGYNGDIDEYREHYKAVTTEHLAIGDLSQYYYYHQLSPKRIANALGDNLKFIFIYREPVSRAISGYWHVTRLNIEKSFHFIEERTFDEVFHINADSPKELLEREEDNLLNAIENKRVFPQFINGVYEEKTAPLYYLRNSFYARYLKNFLEVFDKSQMLFVSLEDYKKEPKFYLRRIFQFLEIDPNYLPNNHQKSFNVGFIPHKNLLAKLAHYLEPYLKYKAPNIHNQINSYYTKYFFSPKPQTKPQTRQYLRSFFKEEVKELSDLTEVDFVKSWQYN